MARWILYASPIQKKVGDWEALETRLASAGLRVSCDPKVKASSKRAYVTVDDPNGVLECPEKGDARCDMLCARVRGLIERCKQWEAT